MFCYQWEQTAGCSGCVGKAGVCGKSADVAKLQDELVGALIGLAEAADGNLPTAFKGFYTGHRKSTGAGSDGDFEIIEKHIDRYLCIWYATTHRRLSM